MEVSRTPGLDKSLRIAVALPSFLPPFTLAVLEWLASTINLCHGNLPQARRSALAEANAARLDGAVDLLRARLKGGGVNTVRMARAAATMQLPLQWLPGGFIHIGSGPSGRIFRSTETETTSALAVALAMSKTLTASLLRQHGLPVPAHRLVRSAEEAVEAARAYGYPVVVKPEDCDGGVGVNAGLMTDEQVRQCYVLAAAASAKVLVERHVHGQDYRITVEAGKVVKAIARQPGGVLGDGARTVQELVGAIAAAAPAARGGGSIVSLDDEALGLLEERGSTPHTVPPAGEFVVLRRRANMSTGGTSSDVIGVIHPDNARLAIRAAQALRLDLAGIDLIIPDISVSWMDCTAAICEVNAGPQISTQFAPDVYRDLLRRMVPAPGRMHAVLVLHSSGEPDADGSVAAASNRLVQNGERVLSLRPDGTWLNDIRLAPPGREPFAFAVAAELERDAAAVVVALTPEQIVKQGLPWLHVDQVRVPSGADPARLSSLRACLQLLAPHLAGPLVLDAQTAALIGPRILDRFTTSIEMTP